MEAAQSFRGRRRKGSDRASWSSFDLRLLSTRSSSRLLVDFHAHQHGSADWRSLSGVGKLSAAERCRSSAADVPRTTRIPPDAPVMVWGCGGRGEAQPSRRRVRPGHCLHLTRRSCRALLQGQRRYRPWPGPGVAAWVPRRREIHQRPSTTQRLIAPASPASMLVVAKPHRTGCPTATSAFGGGFRDRPLGQPGAPLLSAGEGQPLRCQASRSG